MDQDENCLNGMCGIKIYGMEYCKMNGRAEK